MALHAVVVRVVKAAVVLWRVGHVGSVVVVPQGKDLVVEGPDVGNVLANMAAVTMIEHVALVSHVGTREAVFVAGHEVLVNLGHVARGGSRRRQGWVSLVVKDATEAVRQPVARGRRVIARAPCVGRRRQASAVQRRVMIGRETGAAEEVEPPRGVLRIADARQIQRRRGEAVRERGRCPHVRGAQL